MQESNNTDSSSVTLSNHPKWLTIDYLIDKLRIYYKDQSLEITSIEFFPATGKGDNYASVMTRVFITFRKSDCEFNQRSFIVKSAFDDEEFVHRDAFYTEMNFYNDIIPLIQKILDEIDDKDKLFPEAIYVDYNHNAIMFEDLKEGSYIMCDRTKGLDMEHAKMCVKKLAKMHATTAVLNERSPGLFKEYKRGLFNRHEIILREYFLGLLEACGRRVQKWKEFKEYGDKLIALKPKLLEYGNQVFDPNDDHLNVLAHGDVWTNNLMYRYDKNEPKDVILLDFQFSCWGSPAIDLHHFFNTSLKDEIRMNQQDEMFQFYHTILTKMLKELGFKSEIPSLHKFHLQMMEKNFYAFTSACLVQTVMLNEQTNDADFQAMVGTDERAINFRNTLYKSEKVQKYLKELLPIFDRKGLLDIRD